MPTVSSLFHFHGRIPISVVRFFRTTEQSPHTRQVVLTVRFFRTVKKVHSPALEKSEEEAIGQGSQGPIASGMGFMERGRREERHVRLREKKTSSDVHTDRAREESPPLAPSQAPARLMSVTGKGSSVDASFSLDPLQSKSLSLVTLPQRAAEGAVDVSARTDHASTTSPKSL